MPRNRVQIRSVASGYVKTMSIRRAAELVATGEWELYEPARSAGEPDRSGAFRAELEKITLNAKS